MDFHSEIKVADCSAKVELATVVHEGHEFTNMGSVVDEANGVLVGYPHKLPNGSHVLRTWSGADIAPVRLVRKWRQRRSFGGMGFDVFAWSCVYNGRTYSGRNAGMFGGDGCLVRLRARAT